ncbi:hypothetical protein V8F33_012387, partial [Rhypophila sp. PSN 637]
GEPPEIYSKFLDSLAGFIVGKAGGGALILPMVTMALGFFTLVKSLITVSASVILFDLVLGLVVETDNKDTITATATYAAVLGGFVGTSVGAGAGEI